MKTIGEKTNLIQNAESRAALYTHTHVVLEENFAQILRLLIMFI